MEEVGIIRPRIISETELKYLSDLDTAILQRNCLGIRTAIRALQEGGYSIPPRARKFLQASGWTDIAILQSYMVTEKWSIQEE